MGSRCVVVVTISLGNQHEVPVERSKGSGEAVLPDLAEESLRVIAGTDDAKALTGGIQVAAVDYPLALVILVALDIESVLVVMSCRTEERAGWVIRGNCWPLPAPAPVAPSLTWTGPLAVVPVCLGPPTRPTAGTAGNILPMNSFAAYFEMLQRSDFRLQCGRSARASAHAQKCFFFSPVYCDQV